MTFDAGELFRALARHDVAYVTIGGMAIQAYGGQRVTQDLDVTIASSSENYARLAKALVELDARILGPQGRRSRSVPSAGMLASSDQWHLITAHGPLDVVTPPAHLGSFAAMRERAHEVPLIGAAPARKRRSETAVGPTSPGETGSGRSVAIIPSIWICTRTSMRSVTPYESMMVRYRQISRTPSRGYLRRLNIF